MAAYPTLPAWNQPPTEWLSLQQAAVNYGISVDTLRRRIAHGQLPASRFGEDSSESAPETSTDSSDRSQQSTRPFEKHGDGSGPPPFEPWRGSDSLRKWSSARRPGGIRYVQELFAVTHHSPPHSDVYGDYDRLGHLIDDRARPRNK